MMYNILEFKDDKSLLKINPEVVAVGDGYKHISSPIPTERIVCDIESRSTAEPHSQGYFATMVVDFEEQDELDACVSHPNVSNLTEVAFKNQILASLTDEDYNFLIGEVTS